MITIPPTVQDTDLNPFLTLANLIRTEDLANTTLSSSRLDNIELYLAAHFAAVTFEFGGIKSQRKGQSTETYNGIAAKAQDLRSTHYGQVALSIDTSGTLAATLSSKKARFSVVRSVEPPNPDYMDWWGFIIQYGNPS